MAGDRARRLTTWAVALPLALGALVLAVAWAAGPAAGEAASIDHLGAGLLAQRPAALAAAGALLLLLTPMARLAGLCATLRASGDRRAMVSAGVALLALLCAALGPLVMRLAS